MEGLKFFNDSAHFTKAFVEKIVGKDQKKHIQWPDKFNKAINLKKAAHVAKFIPGVSALVQPE